MKKPSFAAMLNKFSDVWIAYDSSTNKVISSAKSAQAALNRAWKAGSKNPVLTKAPKHPTTHII